MTTQPDSSDVTDLGPTKSLTFATPEVEQVRTMFRVDDDDFYAVKPKGGILMRMVLDAGDNTDEFQQARIIDQFIEVAMEPESADRMRARLEDPDDGFDVDTLTDIMQALQGVWGRRPTGRSRASSPRRSRSGRGSTGQRRSTG